MILGFIYLFVALACTGSIYYFLHLYEHWYWFWVIIIGIPVFYVLAFGISLVILFIHSKFIDIHKDVKKPSDYARFWVEQVSYQVAFLAGTFVKKINFDEVNRKQRYMIVYNHTSNFDPMLIFSRIPRTISITKPENKKIPIAGPFAHKAGYISIDRSNNAEGIKAIQLAIDYINERNYSILVSPEGTRSKTHELLPFHPGTFNIAKRAGVPILVIGLKNVYSISKNFLKRPTHVEMNVLTVVSPEHIAETSVGEISNEVHELFENYLGGE